MLPTLIGQSTDVYSVSAMLPTRPMKPPSDATYHRRFLPLMWLNSKSSIGVLLITVISLSGTPACRNPSTARWAPWPSKYSAYIAFTRVSPPTGDRQPQGHAPVLLPPAGGRRP